MSNDKMREEFEAWAITCAWLGLSDECMERDETGYIGLELHAAWLAWQASRAAVMDSATPGDLLGDAIRIEKESDQLNVEIEAFKDANAELSRLNEMRRNHLVNAKKAAGIGHDDDLVGAIEALRKERDKLADENRSLLEDPGSAL